MSIKRCTCAHEQQDRMYGKGMRVHTVNTKGVESCTVCQPGNRARRLATHAREWKPQFGGRP